jgi:hypothetical protein
MLEKSTADLAGSSLMALDLAQLRRMLLRSKTG